MSADLKPGWLARDVERAAWQVNQWQSDREEARIAFLLERLASGNGTEHDVAELAVLNHRRSRRTHHH